jgi:RluA family pseudouridine synthase
MRPTSNTDGGPVNLTWGGATTRLDRALRTGFPEWARADVDAAVSTRRVQVNGRVVWMSSWKVEPGDRIVVHQPPKPKPTGPSVFDPEWIVADEGEYVVLNKPEGLRSEQTRDNDTTPNLLSLLQAAVDDDLVLAHRLDRDTSGLIIATRSGPIRAQLDSMFSTHMITKRYVAIVGTPNRFERSGTIDSFIAPDPKRKDTMRVVERGGKRAVTDYKVVADSGESLRLDVWPRTGRTHQLRVHCAWLGGPIVGDRIYGRGTIKSRLMLHAESLAIPLPGPDTPRTYFAPAPF